MRLIDADKAFDKFFEMWGIEVDAGIADMFMKAINDMPTIFPPPNAPLTLDELREMDGEPVWVVTNRLKEWCIVHSHNSDDVGGGGFIMTRRTAEKRTYPYADCGKTWIAYRHKSEGADAKNTVDTPAKNL